MDVVPLLPLSGRRPDDVRRPPLLNSLSLPSDLTRLGPAALDDLADEIREVLVDTVAVTGGHLGPNLGMVEISLAVHRVFQSCPDRIVFDTGHQAYVHKILTGRAGRLDTLRQAGGLSGYPNRSESPHDVVENSHASTALSYADGLATAARLRGDGCWVVAVVGDGAMTGGMAWEALNNLAIAPDRNVVVVLNDNGRSYSDTVGGLPQHLAALRGGRGRAMDGPGSVFEALGLAYLGPVDGHDRAAVEDALRRAKGRGGTTVVHCVTHKGAGHPPAERDDVDHYHTVRGLDGDGERIVRGTDTWTRRFGEALLSAARNRPDVVAVTAAMLEPTGLGALAGELPERVVDVGIAEQHAVTSAAGMAMAGLHPVVAVYATFLGRAVDQVLLDVGLHRLPVTFVLDRAGVTGPDGASHHGMWDLALLRVVPGLSIAAPRDASRLAAEFDEAIRTDHPTVLRFPTGSPGADLPALADVDGVDVLRHGGSQPDLLVIAVGAMARPCIEAADRARRVGGIRVSVVDPRWVWPVNPALVDLAEAAGAVLTVEDGVRAGGIGDGVSRELADRGVATPVRVLGLPSRYLPHGERSAILAEHDLDVPGLARTMLRVASPTAGRRRWGILHAVGAPGRHRGAAPGASGVASGAGRVVAR